MLSAREERMSVEEALAQMRDFSLMMAADIAYRQADAHESCEDCLLAVGDAIRSMMRPQT